MSTPTQGGDLKQEIINKHPRRWVDDRIWTRAWAMLQDDAKLAMEEYASIKAVAFVEWLTRKDGTYAVMYGDQEERFADEAREYTAAELYAIFQDTK